MKLRNKIPFEYDDEEDFVNPNKDIPFHILYGKDFFSLQKLWSKDSVNRYWNRLYRTTHKPLLAIKALDEKVRLKRAFFRMPRDKQAYLIAVHSLSALEMLERHVHQALLTDERLSSSVSMRKEGHPLGQGEILYPYRQLAENVSRLCKFGRLLNVLEKGCIELERKRNREEIYFTEALRSIRLYRDYPEKLFSEKELDFLGAKELDVPTIGVERLANIIRPYIRSKMEAVAAEIRQAQIPHRREAKRLARLLGEAPSREIRSGKGKYARRRCFGISGPR